MEVGAEELPQFMRSGWTTDFSKHSVSYSEIRSGGPGKDGIRPIDSPKFVDAFEPPDYMRPDEAVMVLEIGGDARAYPLAIMIGHEIVNDMVGGVPVTVTYCPLCNSAVVFDRRLDGRVLDFGTTGNLRNSDLVMWDRQTESWWQQITGEAIVGELTGMKLTFIPSQVLSWANFQQVYPDGKLLTRETGSLRNYDRPPYASYDLSARPFLFSGQIDPRLEALERVFSLEFDGDAIAYPFSVLAQHPVINDTFAGRDLVIFFVNSTLTPFPDDDIFPSGVGGGGGEAVRKAIETAIAESSPDDFLPSRAVGSTAVYNPNVNGQMLTFSVQSGIIVDDQTGSVWDIAGRAAGGYTAGAVGTR